MREGALVILQPRFDAEGLLQLIERYRITHLQTVPTMFVRLLRLPEAVRRKYDLSSLEWVAHGAAPCPTYVKRAMIDWWGPIITEYYGGTESGFVTFHTAEEGAAQAGHCRSAVVIDTYRRVGQRRDRSSVARPDRSAFLRERLADFKVPREIRFETSLPRGDSGKIMKRKLRDPYWEATGRRI